MMRLKNVWEENSKSIPLIAIGGPTGVGKTRIGIFLACKIGGEIVNYDSLQVYKYLDIGTAKPTLEERSQAPHHLIDILEPTDPFNAALFIEKADRIIQDIFSRGKIPILVGGTGLYLKALLHGLFEVGDVSEIRKKWQERLKRNGLSSLYEKLKKVDPETARKISPSDRIRILRALEVYEATGKTFSQLAKEHAFSSRRYPCLKIGLYWPREKLYSLLDQRVDLMLASGFIEEVKSLLKRGFSPRLKPFRAIGYRHMIAYLKGEYTLEEAIRLMKRDTRRYAKRQLTWFRADPEMKWFLPNEETKIYKEVKEFISKFKP